MAWAAETLDEQLVSTTHVEWRINGTTNSTVSPYNQIIGAIRNVGALNVEEKFYELKGHNSGGELQIMNFFKTERGPGFIEFDIPWVPDLDGANWLGFMKDVELKGMYPKNASKGWKIDFPKALVVAKNFQPKPGEPATTRVAIMPYNALGTPPWTFDKNVTL